MSGDRYPPFPHGGAHVISHAIAKYVVDRRFGTSGDSNSGNSSLLLEYQGEDTSLAIWMDEAAWRAGAFRPQLRLRSVSIIRIFRNHA